MPIIKHNGQLIYFSHIPKCGGSTIENYLFQITKSNLSFVDTSFHRQPNQERWNNSSPQHILGSFVQRLFPIYYFNIFFSIVRNPINRFYSAFEFNKRKSLIDPSIDINYFVENFLSFNPFQIGNYDNHFFPQVSFLYPKANYQVFKLEDGLEPVKIYIDNIILGKDSGIPMPHVDFHYDDSIVITKQVLTSVSEKIIRDIYKIDFDIFKY